VNELYTFKSKKEFARVTKWLERNPQVLKAIETLLNMDYKYEDGKWKASPGRLNAAIYTLDCLGYTYEGGEIWNPPLGKEPPKCPTCGKYILMLENHLPEYCPNCGAHTDGKPRPMQPDVALQMQFLTARAEAAEARARELEANVCEHYIDGQCHSLRGEWQRVGLRYYCSVCNAGLYTAPDGLPPDYNYCPFCGAKMVAPEPPAKGGEPAD